MSFRESVTFFHIPVTTTIAATQIKSNPGVLHTIVLNTVGATPAVITISDGTLSSSTVIAVITSIANTTVAPLTAYYDIRFNVGLVLSAIANTNTVDATICYE